MRYGIDIVDEWMNVPNYSQGVKFFDSIAEAKKWGERNTDPDDPINCGFLIFKVGSDKVIYHSLLKNSYPIDSPIESRFDILDL